MGKQISSIQIKGRLHALSYYKEKGVKVGTVRTIDPNASERVRTLPQYATFRAHGGEFGSIGWLASGLVLGILNRRYMVLNSFRTGDLTQTLLPYLAQDGAHELGQRDLIGTGFRDGVLATLNGMSKTPPQNLLGANYDFSVYENLPGTPSVCHFEWLPSDMDMFRLQRSGITAISYNMYGFIAYIPEYDTTTGKYNKPSRGWVPMHDGVWDISSGVTFGIDGSFPFYSPDDKAIKVAYIQITPQRRMADGNLVAVNSSNTFIAALVRQN